MLGHRARLTFGSSQFLEIDSENRYLVSVNRKHRATLERIFARQTPANLPWRDVEGLLRGLGAEMEEGAGSRVVVTLNEIRAVFHRPHPRPETKKGAVRAVRGFLRNAGVKP
jgi:HicA toxin of bacterial toxin-antitoxin,